MSDPLRTYQDLADLVSRRLSGLPDSHRRMAAYVLRHYQEVAFMTATELATALQTSQPTVTRFVASLGFDGYPQFVKSLQNIVRMQLKATDRMTLASRSAQQEGRYDWVLEQEAEHVLRLRETLDAPAFTAAVNAIAGAETVVVAGVRASAALVQYMAYFLAKIRPGVLALADGGSTVYDRTAHLDPGSTVVAAMVFPRYPREMLQFLQYAGEQGFRIISLTDSVVSPATRWSDLTLVAPISLATLFDSYTAPMALINLLIDAVGQVQPERSRQRLAQLEKVFQRQRVFETGG